MIGWYITQTSGTFIFPLFHKLNYISKKKLQKCISSKDIIMQVLKNLVHDVSKKQHQCFCSSPNSQRSTDHQINAMNNPLWLWNTDPALWLKKGSWHSKLSGLGNFFVSPTWNIRPTTGCGARSTSLWVQRNLFWQLSRDGNLHDSGMSHAMTASPKPRLQGTMESGRRCGQQRKCWMDNIKEWTFLPTPDLLTRACCEKENWKKISAESSLTSPDDPVG